MLTPRIEYISLLIFLSSALGSNIIFQLWCSVFGLVFIFNVQHFKSKDGIYRTTKRIMFGVRLVLIFNVKHVKSKSLVHITTEIIMLSVWISFDFQCEASQIQQLNIYLYWTLLYSPFELVLLFNVQHMNCKSLIHISTEFIMVGVWIGLNFYCETCQL